MSCDPILGFEKQDIFFERDEIIVIEASKDSATVRVNRQQLDADGDVHRGFSFCRTIEREDLASALATLDLSTLSPGSRLSRRNGYCCLLGR